MHRSLWLEEAVPPTVEPEPQLSGDTRTDIAIIGGGYVGLWTAIRIKELIPSTDVVVVEQDICGGGASGRNGGFVLSWWAKLGTLIDLYGKSAAVELCRASEAAIHEIGTFTAAHQIDAHFVHAGWLWTATTRAQIGAWDRPVTLCEELGLDAFIRLDPGEVARRAGSRRHLAGVLEKSGATVQPAALARGLRTVALSLGIRIFEQTPVTSFTRDSPVVITTPRGTLKAARLVIATNAWAANLPELARAIVVVSSDIVATRPIPDKLRSIGWTGGEGVTDSQQMVDYYRTTRDGRIVFGKGGWGIAYGGRIGPEFDRDEARARTVISDFHRLYPMLADVPIERDWSGAIDRSVNGLPVVGWLGGREHISYGIGWSGNGVGPSVVGGRMLASLALGLKNEWSASPMINRRFGTFPPEPIRYIGAHIVRAAVQSKEQAEARGESPSRIARTLARLAPEGLEGH
jgi:putative aminophosphonate oxidoreductase